MDGFSAVIQNKIKFFAKIQFWTLSQHIQSLVWKVFFNLFLNFTYVLSKFILFPV